MTAAEESIRSALLNYFVAIDSQNLDAVRECFAPTASLAYPPVYSGDVEGFIRHLEGPNSLGGYDRTIHVPSVVSISVADAVATTRTYCVAYHATRPEHPWGGDFVTVWVTYDDTLELAGSRWLVTNRTCTFAWIKREAAIEDGHELTRPRSAAR